MKCNGTYDCCGARCDECVRLFDDCDGHPDYEDYNGEWLPVEQVEALEYKEGLGI